MNGMTFQELVKMIRENECLSRSLALMLTGRSRSSEVYPSTKEGKGFVYSQGAEEAKRIKEAMQREKDRQKTLPKRGD